MEVQETQNSSQKCIEKKLRTHTSWFKNLLQSYNDQHSVLLA